MKGWNKFLADAPERVVEVIENGPMPLADYGNGSNSFTNRDKKMGLLKFKGGTGRAPEVSMKRGTPAIVYFDPVFCEGEHVPIEVPSEVLDRHKESEVLAAFKQL